MRGVGQRPVTRFPGGAQADDEVALEEPLEIRAAGETIAVTMRTPGADRELAVGFLFAEGVIAGTADLGTVAHCGHPGDEGYGNTIDAIPAGGVSLDVERVSAARRGTLTTAACGVCGRRSVADVIARCQPLPPGPVVAAQTIANAVDGLRGLQPNFSRTGGIHAAALFDASGAPLASFEDIGRHNAVDKAVGALLLSNRLGQATLLVVSGRSSFEIVQKAAAARVPIVASVSAASSLAVDTACAVGMTLCGFVRGGTMTVYSGAERLG